MSSPFYSNVVPCYWVAGVWCFKTTWWSQLQGSKQPFIGLSTLKDGTNTVLWTLVHQSPSDMVTHPRRSPPLYHCESLKPCKSIIYSYRWQNCSPPQRYSHRKPLVIWKYHIKLVKCRGKKALLHAVNTTVWTCVIWSTNCSQIQETPLFFRQLHGGAETDESRLIWDKNPQ